MSNIQPQEGQDRAHETSAGEEAAQSGSDEAAKDESGPSTSQGQRQGRQCGSVKPKTQLPQQLNGSAMRIRRELNEITLHPPPNCSAEMYNEDQYHWKATINGPSGTVYEGGIFKLDIRFPVAYPFRPPQIRFITRIYHCNVDGRGVICLDVLNERWSPVMNIAKILLSIWVLIGECNPNDPLVMGIADQYKCNRKKHDKIARYWTKRYATPKGKSKDEDLQQEQEKDPEQQQDEQHPGQAESVSQLPEQLESVESLPVPAEPLTTDQEQESAATDNNEFTGKI